MKLALLAATSACLLSGCVLVSAREVASDAPQAGTGLTRAYASPTAPYAKSIIIPPGYETIRLPGIVADPLTPGGADYGTTEQQTESVLKKIAAALNELGASEGDVVAATVYLAAPESASSMDFDAMMRAWTKHYGTAAQPNRPVRSTVEVAGLVRPGMLVEIEVTAARPAR